MPKKRSTKRDLQAAAGHVSYEIEMLIFAGSELGGWHSSPMCPPEKAQANMALESFLLHFRNLRDFLCPPKNWTDGDVFASHFLGKDELLAAGNRKILGRDKVRLDKMLVHLSYTRKSFIASGGHGWPVARMSIDILDEIEKFLVSLAQLRPEMRSLFLSSEVISNRKFQASLALDDSTQEGVEP